MKFINFDFATHSVPVTMAIDAERLPFYLDEESKRIVLCAEVNKEDLKIIRDQGKIYIMLEGFLIPPPIGVQANNPFSLTQHENDIKESASHDKQSNEGDNKLSIT